LLIREYLHLKARYDSFVHYHDSLLLRIYRYVVAGRKQEAGVSGDEF